VLDIGCGTGALLERLIQLHPDIRVFGIDTSAAMLAEAGKRLGSRATLVIQDSERLPEFAEPFDVIISSNVLHYIENPADWLGQMHGLLKPGGLLILQDFSKSSRAVRYGTWLMRRIDRGFRQAYGLDEVKVLMVEVGFSVEKRNVFPIDWLWKGWLVRARPVADQS